MYLGRWKLRGRVSGYWVLGARYGVRGPEVRGPRSRKRGVWKIWHGVENTGCGKHGVSKTHSIMKNKGCGKHGVLKRRGGGKDGVWKTQGVESTGCEKHGV